MISVSRARAWWPALALLLANVLVLIFLVLPARQERQRQEDQLLDLQRRVRALQREMQTSEATLTAFRQTEEFAHGFPARAEAVELKGQLTRLARRLDIEIPAVSYHPEELKDVGLVKMTMSMNVQGAYAKIRRYLYELEGMRRHLVIERVSFSDPRGNAELSLQVQLAMYLRAEEKQG